MNKSALTALMLSLSLGLSACSSVQDRLSRVGQPPELAAIEDPTTVAGYRPVSVPLPDKTVAKRNPNSLWRSGARSFFKDMRASEVGDLLTVVIQIDDEAQLSNSSQRSRANSEDMGLSSLFGIEGTLGQFLAGDPDPSNIVDVSSNLSNSGTGSIDREEEINLRVAALVTQKLPNGNLVVVGRQEVRVNYEVRELQVAGIVRPQDITSANTIPFDKIAEARISYGGRGHISDVQKPRYGQEVLDILLPF